MINGVSNTLYYDKNGAITQYDAASGSDKFIAYNSINQPTKITVGASLDDVSALARDEFKYTPDGERYYKKSTYWQNGVQRVEHTFYVGDYEATIYDTQSPTYKSEKSTFGDFVHIRKTPYVGSPTEAQLYLYRDHQGSVDATVGAGSTTLFAFEPFGARRNSNTLSGNITAAQLSDILLKDDVLPYAGYTGHESLDRTGFIHMNGRVYDPQLSRFLSPDPFVQLPDNSQNWNRYSYVLNNPLKYTDPTGYKIVVVCKGNAEKSSVSCYTYDDGTFTYEIPNTRESPNTCTQSEYLDSISRDPATGELLYSATNPEPGLNGVYPEAYLLGGAGAKIAAEAVTAKVAAQSMAKNTVPLTWKTLGKEKQNAVNSYMTKHGIGKEGAKKLLQEIKEKGVPAGLDKKSLAVYRDQIKSVGGKKEETKASDVFQTRLEILNRILGE